MKLKYIVKIFVITYLIFGITNSFEENKIAYIDMNKILNKSKVGIFVEKELTKKHEAKLDNFKKIEEKLKKEEIDLISKRNIMAREEFEEKVNLLKLVNKKPITATIKEVEENPSSRSAKLRSAIKQEEFYDFETDILDKFKYLIDIEKYSQKL